MFQLCPVCFGDLVCGHTTLDGVLVMSQYYPICITMTNDTHVCAYQRPVRCVVVSEIKDVMLEAKDE